MQTSLRFSGKIDKEKCYIENIPDGPIPFRVTRSCFKSPMTEEVDPEKNIQCQLKVFCEDLIKELNSVFREKDLELIETTRNLTDFRGMAIQLKKLSPAFLHESKGKEFIISFRIITRLLKKVDDESLSLQHIWFLRSLMELTNKMSIEDLQKTNSKTLIKQFVDDKNCYTGVEFIIHGVLVASIKVSVESVAESMISKYALHFSKLRNLNEEKVHYEMMIDVNGPEIGECDAILKESLNHYFSGEKWHFNTSSAAAFRTSGVATTKVLSNKSKMMIY